MFKTGKQLRESVRNGCFKLSTSGQAPGYVQANLVILEKDWAWDFLLFAQRNPKPCPVLEVGDAGSPFTTKLAKNADIRKDIPKYRIYKHGQLTNEVYDIDNIWQDNFVFFLIGCSFSFEQALINASLEIRNITENVNVPMYITNKLCKPAGKFKPSPTVVSMRPFKALDVIKAVEITSQFPHVHGSPIHLGDPSIIGIKDINKPDFGSTVTIKAGEMPVFWACGVTPQLAAITSKPPIMITHAPGYMFVSDVKESELK
ncbi:putative hydro-lyase [Clostridium sp. 'deep sea']|uniref:putative hydro-lyase n=1 Tax=Clostridium sp. 'deep sea' TaxID=2779445 RepID=UPI001FACD77F|nr:putative hydro-lyase [Clostridium sp. 'deep sea']